MQRLSAVCLLAALAACSTGIVPTDEGKYMISTKGSIWSNPDGIKADEYTEANKFCADKGMTVETVSAKAQDAVPFVRHPNATLEFRCVPARQAAAASAP